MEQRVIEVGLLLEHGVIVAEVVGLLEGGLGCGEQDIILESAEGSHLRTDGLAVILFTGLFRNQFPHYAHLGALSDVTQIPVFGIALHRILHHHQLLRLLLLLLGLVLEHHHVLETLLLCSHEISLVHCLGVHVLLVGKILLLLLLLLLLLKL